MRDGYDPDAIDDALVGTATDFVYDLEIPDEIVVLRLSALRAHAGIVAAIDALESGSWGTADVLAALRDVENRVVEIVEVGPNELVSSVEIHRKKRR